MALYTPDGKRYFPDDAMTLEDYKTLCGAVVHMSVDIEDAHPMPGEDGFDDEMMEIYALIQYMVNTINDVPARLVEYAVEDKGITLPEADY